MLELKDEKVAIPVVLFAGLLWSFGPLIVRYMNDPNLVPWQYLFTRGLTIFFILNIYLFFDEGKNFYKNYLNIGLSGITGGIGLGIAMITFIWSITNTSAAITLLCLAAMPFITALLGFLFLRETISINVWLAIIIAAVGIVIMAAGKTNEGSLFGVLFGLISATGFSVFSVSLRWRKVTPKFTTVAVAGLFCAIVSALVLINSGANFLSSSYNQGLFSIHGTIVCLGMILYAIASKNIPAAELTLLSLTEIIGGIFWVWLPILGINEVPTNSTIIGGFLIFMSIIYYSLTIKTNRRFIALN
jgi:RarD protein